jgi:Uma2 family endonuclease
MKTLAKWSIEQYHRMVDAGILQGRAVELLAGEIVEMSPETPIHYATAKQNAKYLESLLANKAEVRFNGPITLSDSEPEPDVAIVRLPATVYREHHPGAADIFWLIEVAKTSLKTDLELKASIYATAGIQEYWIVDLTDGRVIVFRQPQAGTYVYQQSLQTGTIQPLAFPQIEVSVQQLLA